MNAIRSVPSALVCESYHLHTYHLYTYHLYNREPLLPDTLHRNT